MWYLWVSASLAEETPKSPFVRIRVGHANLEKVGLTFEGLVEQYDTSPESVIKHCNCLALNQDMVLKFKNKLTEVITVSYDVSV